VSGVLRLGKTKLRFKRDYPSTILEERKWRTRGSVHIRYPRRQLDVQDNRPFRSMLEQHRILIRESPQIIVTLHRWVTRKSE
jgi:CDP-glycerol glycerophosphotransferase (TagB/SpsB family)